MCPTSWTCLKSSWCRAGGQVAKPAHGHPRFKGWLSHHSSHYLWGTWNAIKKKALVHTFFPNNAFSYYSRSDSLIFLFSFQKVAVKAGFGVLFYAPPFCHFQPLHTELSQLYASVCLVQWKSPDVEIWIIFLSGQVPFGLSSKCFSLALACLRIYLFLGGDAVSTRTVCALP